MKKNQNEKLSSSLQENLEDTLTRLTPPTDDVNYSKAKFQNWSCILYEDTTDYDCLSLLSDIEQYCNDKGYLFCSILHDKDYYLQNTYDDNYNLVGKVGELKKPHLHVLVAQDSYSYLCDLSTRFHLQQHYFQRVKKVDAYINYLTHKDEPKKHLYSFDDIHTNRPNFVGYVLDTYHINDVMHYVYNRCCDDTKNFNFRDLVSYCVDNGLQIKPKDFQLIRELINEHKSIYHQNIQLDNSLDKARVRSLAQLKKSCDEELNHVKKINKLSNVFDRVNVLNDDGSINTIMCVQRKEK